MDGALRDYQKNSIEEAKVQIKEVKRLVKEVKGQFTYDMMAAQNTYNSILIQLVE